MQVPQPATNARHRPRGLQPPPSCAGRPFKGLLPAALAPRRAASRGRPLVAILRREHTIVIAAQRGCRSGQAGRPICTASEAGVSQAGGSKGRAFVDADGVSNSPLQRPLVSPCESLPACPLGGTGPRRRATAMARRMSIQ
eukprot:scaffold7694_cov430-Prasinococcus_capsulatus_cf.AAC.2